MGTGNVFGEPGRGVFGVEPHTTDGLITNSVEAVFHYMFGGGKAAETPFSEINTSSIKPSMFNAIKRKLEARQPGSYPINGAAYLFDLGVLDNPDNVLIFGGIVLRLHGRLEITNCSCGVMLWSFEGELSSAPDDFNFNRQDGKPGQRGRIAEFSTWIGGFIPGTPYIIDITGTKPISEEGSSP